VDHIQDSWDLLHLVNDDVGDQWKCINALEKAFRPGLEQPHGFWIKHIDPKGLSLEGT
jgi:hypothetical protein